MSNKKKNIWVEFYKQTLWKEGDWTKEKLLKRKKQPQYKLIGDYMEKIKRALDSDKVFISGENKGIKVKDYFIKRTLDEYIIKPEDITDDVLKEIMLGNFAELHGYEFEDIKNERERKEILELWKSEYGISFEEYKISDIKKKDIINTIIKDQKDTLMQWINYLDQVDIYPLEFKYWVLRKLKKLGRLDKKRWEFMRRTRKTISPYPELDQAALGFVYELLELKLEGKDYNKFIEENSNLNKEDKERLKKAVKDHSFKDMYALALKIQYLKITPKEILAIVNGKWKKYEEVSQAEELADSLANYKTGWCIANVGTAESYLEDSEVYIYYSNDKNGNPVIPRLAIVREKESGKVVEIRGIDPSQNVDEYILPVLEDKIKIIPGAEEYMDALKEQKLLVNITKKIKRGGKLEDFTDEEFRFIVEKIILGEEIKTFGYSSVESRIASIEDFVDRDIEKDINKWIERSENIKEIKGVNNLKEVLIKRKLLIEVVKRIESGEKLTEQEKDFIIAKIIFSEEYKKNFNKRRYYKKIKKLEDFILVNITKKIERGSDLKDFIDGEKRFVLEKVILKLASNVSWYREIKGEMYIIMQFIDNNINRWIEIAEKIEVIDKIKEILKMRKLLLDINEKIEKNENLENFTDEEMRFIIEKIILRRKVESFGYGDVKNKIDTILNFIVNNLDFIVNIINGLDNTLNGLDDIEKERIRKFKELKILMDINNKIVGDSLNLEDLTTEEINFIIENIFFGKMKKNRRRRYEIDSLLEDKIEILLSKLITECKKDSSIQFFERYIKEDVLFHQVEEIFNNFEIFENVYIYKFENIEINKKDLFFQGISYENLKRILEKIKVNDSREFTKDEIILILKIMHNFPQIGNFLLEKFKWLKAKKLIFGLEQNEKKLLGMLYNDFNKFMSVLIEEKESFKEKILLDLLIYFWDMSGSVKREEKISLLLKDYIGYKIILEILAVFKQKNKLLEIIKKIEGNELLDDEEKKFVVKKVILNEEIKTFPFKEDIVKTEMLLNRILREEIEKNIDDYKSILKEDFKYVKNLSRYIEMLKELKILIRLNDKIKGKENLTEEDLKLIWEDIILKRKDIYGYSEILDNEIRKVKRNFLEKIGKIYYKIRDEKFIQILIETLEKAFGYKKYKYEYSDEFRNRFEEDLIMLDRIYDKLEKNIDLTEEEKSFIVRRLLNEEFEKAINDRYGYFEKYGYGYYNKIDKKEYILKFRKIRDRLKMKDINNYKSILEKEKFEIEKTIIDNYIVFTTNSWKDNLNFDKQMVDTLSRYIDIKESLERLRKISKEKF